MSEHTPGPWRYDEIQYIFGPSQQMVAEIRGLGAGLPQAANARLIAMAPELLIACEGALVALKLVEYIDRTQAIEYIEELLARLAGADEDPTPYCGWCGAKEAKYCNCPPRARND